MISVFFIENSSFFSSRIFIYSTNFTQSFRDSTFSGELFFILIYNLKINTNYKFLINIFKFGVYFLNNKNLFFYFDHKIFYKYKLISRAKY